MSPLSTNRVNRLVTDQQSVGQPYWAVWQIWKPINIVTSFVSFCVSVRENLFLISLIAYQSEVATISGQLQLECNRNAIGMRLKCIWNEFWNTISFKCVISESVCQSYPTKFYFYCCADCIFVMFGDRQVAGNNLGKPQSTFGIQQISTDNCANLSACLSGCSSSKESHRRSQIVICREINSFSGKKLFCLACFLGSILDRLCLVHHV